MTIEELTKAIISGEKTVRDVELETRKSHGGGNYSEVGVYITEDGLEAGWKSNHAGVFFFRGAIYTESGRTLENGIVDGHLALTEHHRTMI
jgi:hypothetical protein